MKVGVSEATELKKRSKELGIPFADLLWGYVIEDLMFRICDSQYGDLLWLETFPVLGKAAYREKERKTISFYYHESEKKIPTNKQCPGQKLSIQLAECMMNAIFGMKNVWQVHWSWKLTMEHGRVEVRLIGVYRDMEVPVTLSIRAICGEKLSPGARTDDLPALGGRQITYPIYAPENRLCQEIFTIVERLELISDMESYYYAYRILKSQHLNGRYVMDEMSRFLETSPRVKKEQRIEQLAGYRSYGYMRKRWDKYLRHHGHEELDWQEVLDLIVTFLKPIWHALCCDEMFFDDWLPDIGRFI
jgi:hypothetical protein